MIYLNFLNRLDYANTLLVCKFIDWKNIIWSTHLKQVWYDTIMLFMIWILRNQNAIMRVWS